MHNRSVFSYLFRKRRGEIKFILFLSGVRQRAKRGVSQEAGQTSLRKIIREYLRLIWPAGLREQASPLQISG
ncbi:hypothetical protein E4524_21010 [Escherichia coli]|uniref:Uncharacterized protein n=1 Tax=Salmonella typhimurium TaxID=90371 RepID=A0A6Y2A7P9_SALTM|nr:hypothetical protein [Salmonella enterica]ECB1323127.1 hypothetical protein [Salmonella enterica subsp. enterica serovar Panama]EDP9698753.1 hypothetical protein [Salmonella enterica subsp. enterica serovar Eastbourne]EDX5159134.1 hypothetical protein [Salmonella enterica subsp. enterica serovar 4,[5],12:i:-]EEA3251759.1 hypothetical protein [Salmonella enterica subsp. enterica serovar Typhimurium]EEV6351921.1 hypothetical protein [Escherichia coli]QKA29589.1 hypothetical protein E3165_286